MGIESHGSKGMYFKLAYMFLSVVCTLLFRSDRGFLNDSSKKHLMSNRERVIMMKEGCFINKDSILSYSLYFS